MKPKRNSSPRYVGPKRDRISWPPHQRTDGDKPYLHPGEPKLLALGRWKNDKSLSTSWWLGCCACGFRHVLTFNVFRDISGDFWLACRAYADESTRPASVKRARKRRLSRSK